MVDAPSTDHNGCDVSCSGHAEQGEAAELKMDDDVIVDDYNDVNPFHEGKLHQLPVPSAIGMNGGGLGQGTAGTAGR